MAQFPISSDQGILDAMNYVLSGPIGLGQNFAGFSSSLNGDATGNYRPPFTIDNFGTLPNIYLEVAPIALSTSEMLDGRTWKFTFATPLTGVPFINGQPVTVSGVTDPTYNGYYSPIGVIDCTLTDVTVRTEDTYPIVAPSTGGTIELNSMLATLSTDCNAKVTVTGAQQRVVLNAQLNNTIYVDASYAPFSLKYTVELNRYKAIPTYDPINPEYRFVPDTPYGNIARKEITIDVPPGFIGPALDPIESLFISIIDNPGLGVTDYKGGYYWYILEVRYEFVGSPPDTPVVTNSVLGLRSFSAQVLKP